MHWDLQHEFIYDGRSIRYGVAGKGPPIVVVHGTPWSSFNMRHLINGLAEVFSVFFYDLIGYGQSDKSDGDVSLGIQNDILAAMISDEWKLDSPVVIGHDFGGATVLRTHLINGVGFEKIVLIDPVAVTPWGSEFFTHVREYERAFAGVPDYIQDAIVRAYVKSAAYLPLDEEILTMTVTPWTRGAGKAAFYRQIAQADVKYTDEVQGSYPDIRRPALILWGEEDRWIPVERGRELHRLIPGSRFASIPGAGHLVIEEKPDELLSLIVPFLDGPE